ncbi:hypothetical protein TWF569_004293 [Orbilia oligospora]|nr:hypothetical protein TWF569_004293 [Orbilia oligospora]
MEALGIAASIVGLLAAGAKLIPWLVNIADKVADAPISVKAVSPELKETIIILEAIQLYVLDRQAVAENRWALILLEHISVTLSGFVLTYSDLERHVDFVQPDKEMSVFDRSKWLLKEKEILDVIRRLQNHKSSLSTMLNILQCQTLRQDQGLVAQLERRRAAPESMAIMPVPDVTTPSAISVRDDTSTTASKQSNTSRVSKISMLSLFPGPKSPERRKGPTFEFEKDLKTSWVYKRSSFGFLSQSKTSLLSRRGTERGVAMSALSKVSWTEIPNLSVFNLPVFASDIYNSEWYGPIFASGPVESPESVHRPNSKLGPDVESILKEIKQSKLFWGKQTDTAEDITTRADELQPPWVNLIKISVNQDHKGTYSDEIMKWASGRDPSMDFLRESQHRIHSSGQWFLGHPTYKNWLNHDHDSPDSRFLRITRCPGSGKTVLSTSIIDDLQSKRQRPQSLVRSALTCTTYFYCSAVNRNGQLQNFDYFTIVLSSLIKQILRQLLYLPTSVIECYQRSLAKGRSSLSAADDSETLLESLAQEFDSLFIVIDDPDELYDGHGAYGTIEPLFRLTSTIPNVKTILLSRITFHLDILYSFPIIKLGDPNTSEDINRYIRDGLSRLQERNAIKGFSPEIFNKISQRVNGMFLWARLMINSLWLGQVNNEEEALEAASSTPEGLQQIAWFGADGHELDIRRKVIMLMCAASRPLQWSELKHMLNTSEESWERDYEESIYFTAPFGWVVVHSSNTYLKQIASDFFIHLYPKGEFEVREDEAHENIAGILMPTDAVSNYIASRNLRITNPKKLMIIKDLCREYTIRKSLEGEK